MEYITAEEAISLTVGTMDAQEAVMAALGLDVDGLILLHNCSRWWLCEPVEEGGYEVIGDGYIRRNEMWAA